MGTSIRRDRIYYLLSPVAVLIAWEMAGRLGVLDTRFFPRPLVVLSALWKMVLSGELFIHMSASLTRTILGFAIGTLCGILIGMVMGLVRPVRAFLTPLVALTYPMPKLAILPLIVLLLGIGELSKIVTIAIGVFFLVLINTLVGVLNIPPVYFDLAKNYHLSRIAIYRHVILPGALPMIFAGARLGMGSALILVVSAEFMGAKTGLGYMIWQAWLTFSLDTMFIGLVMIAFLSILFSSALDEIERRCIPWRQERA